MARLGVWKSGILIIGGVDLSDHVREMSLDTSVAELPDHCHGDNTAKVAAGLEDWTINVTFLQDFAASKVDATLRGGSIGTVGHSPTNIIIGATQDAASSTNPRYSGNAILASYQPMGGEHGVNLSATATFRAAGNLTRQVA